MAHGTPDWGVTAGRSKVYQLTDMGELAVRLGSIVSFDRRGDVTFLDSFEFGLRAWTASTSGAGAAVDITTGAARSGFASARLVAGSDSNRAASIQHLDIMPALSALGAECSFALSSTIETLDLEHQIFDGTDFIDWRVRWDETNTRLQYFDSSGAWVTFATGVDLAGGAGLFHTMKLRVDFAKRQYINVVFNETSYGLDGIAPQVTASPLRPQLITEILLTGRSGQNDRVHIDDVILTQNEPA